LRVQPKVGGILHPRLNTDGRPIAHKYRKGKMQRTLKREFKELEAVEREAIVDYCVNDQFRASIIYLERSDHPEASSLPP